MEFMTWQEIAKISPIAAICGINIYFGYWLRKGEIEALRDFIRYLETRTSSQSQK